MRELCTNNYGSSPTLFNSCYLIYALSRLERQLPTAGPKRFTLRVTAEKNGAAVKYEKTKLTSLINRSSKPRSINLRMFSYILYF